MVELLVHHPVLLLFVLVGVGSALGALNVRGLGLGPAAVLFVALAASAVDPRLALSADVQTLGLVLFTYAVGLACGPGFVAGLRGRGLRALGVVLAAVGTAAALAVAVGTAAGLSRVGTAGLLTGALTNTPALGVVIGSVPADAGGDAAAGYALAYPAGVLGALVASGRVLRRSRREDAPAAPPIVAATVEVQVSGLPALARLEGDVTFSRHSRAGDVRLAAGDIVPERGDLLMVVGAQDRVEGFIGAVGSRVEQDLSLDRSTLDVRRITVSSAAVVGRPLGELDLERRFGATATRLRRGDLDMLARPDLVLEPGDRVRVVAPSGRLPELARFLGDSDTAVAQIDFVAVALGLAAGILLGTVPLPGGITLGAAGGTLLTGIVLGALGRVRRRTFALGHQASLTLRQVGTVVFLAAVGSRSGAAFASAAFSWRGLATAAAGMAVTAAAMTVVSWAGRRWLDLDDVTLAGAVAGAQTQPAVLAFAERRTGADHRVAVGYTALYPAAMMLKIVAAQLVTRL